MEAEWRRTGMASGWSAMFTAPLALAEAGERNLASFASASGRAATSQGTWRGGVLAGSGRSPPGSGRGRCGTAAGSPGWCLAGTAAADIDASPAPRPSPARSPRSSMAAKTPPQSAARPWPGSPPSCAPGGCQGRGQAWPGGDSSRPGGRGIGQTPPRSWWSRSGRWRRAGPG